MACETEAIRREVALLDEAGQRRRVEQIDRLELELVGVAIPPGQRWIDSPGINDTEAMNRCARRASREGDLLLWILTSRQMLSEVEMAFLAEEIGEPLERDDTYSERLNRALGALGKEARRDFLDAVAEAARRHRHSALPRAVRERIGCRLTPAKLRVEVANNDVESGGWIGGALAGAAAGTAVPIIGTFFGALTGAAAGATMATQAAIDQDVAETRDNARRAARSAAGLVDEKEEEIRRAILEHFRAAEAGPAEVNAAPLERLRQITELLERTMEEARGLATAPLW